MSRPADTADILARLRAADPVELAELERTVAPLRARIKQRAIDQGILPREPVPAGDRAAVEAGARPAGGLARRGRRPRLVLASLACAAVLAAVIVFFGGPIGPGGRGAYPGFAEAAVEVAEANPRLLVTAPGWKVVDARSFKASDGQLYFAAGKRRIYLAWMPAAYYREVAAAGGPRVEWQSTSTIAGRTATTTQRERGGGAGSWFQTTFPPEGGVFVSLQGAFQMRGEWERLTASVRSVGVEEWLRAMPAAIIRPDAIAGELTRMLRGVPVPPGFDASAAVGPTQLTNRFQAAKNLTQALTCGWVERWGAARRDGDAATAAEAVEAMSGADRWPVLLRMAREKGYRGRTLPAPGYGWPTSIIEIGRQMAAGRVPRERVATKRRGRVTAEGFEVPEGAYPPDAVVCFPPSRASR